MTPIRTVVGSMETAYGLFHVDVFVVGGTESVVLRTHDIPGANEDVLCRIQSECIGHVFFDEKCDCMNQIGCSLQRIQEAGSGLLVYLRQEGMGLGIAGRLKHIREDWRTYDVAISILEYYRIQSVSLIAINKRKIEAVQKSAIKVVRHLWHERVILLGDQIVRAVEDVKDGISYPPIIDEKGRPKILIMGDLNVDRFDGQSKVGGSGFNASQAFKKTDAFLPIIFGKVGDDEYGLRIRGAIAESDAPALLGVHKEKATGCVSVVSTAVAANPFQYSWEKRNNANDYDADQLQQAIALANISPTDYIFVASYLLVQKLFDIEKIREVLDVAAGTGAGIILDLVGKSFASDVLEDCGTESFSKDDLLRCVEGIRFHVISGQMNTFDRLGFESAYNKKYPDRDVFLELLKTFNTDWVICRSAGKGIIKQSVASRVGEGVSILSDVEMSEKDIRIGLGDEMTAEALVSIQDYIRLNPKV